MTIPYLEARSVNHYVQKLKTHGDYLKCMDHGLEFPKCDAVSALVFESQLHACIVGQTPAFTIGVWLHFRNT